MSSATATTLDPLLLIPKPGSGFDNFIPKKDKKTEKTEETDVSSEKKESAGTKESKESSDTKESKENKTSEKTNGKESGGDSFHKDERGYFGGGGAGGNNDDLLWAVVAVMAVLVFASVVDRATGDDPDSLVQSREMTWPQLHALLEKNEVEKLVVTRDASWAQVYLKLGSAGVPTSHRATYSSAPAEHEEGIHSDVDVVEGLEATTNTTTTSPAKHSHRLVYRFAIGSVDTLEHKLEDAQLGMGRDYKNHVPIQYSPTSTVATELLGIFPYVVVYGILFFFMRNSMRAGGPGGVGGGIFQIGKSTAKKINKQDISVTFKDVAGCDEAKREIMEFVDFLQDPTRFTKLGAKIPKGALLCGPPGTGKTLLAKATAGESGVPFFSISGSDFIEMFVGVGPSRVRDLFKEARENAPCIVFIDEIDAVGRQRGRGGVGGNDERENTLNQLLVEMDGFNPSAGVVVLAATNRVDILDQALTRPGRFDRQITVDRPDLNGRKQIFMVHLDGLILEEDPDEIAGRLAGLTPGFAGADIANLCNEAAIVAARRKAESVSMDDFEKATDRIVGGLESNKIMSKEERSIVAHHEAGHAIAGWFLEHADPLLKVTIIPRSSGALGYAQYLPKEVFLRTQDQIMDIVCMALAGRAAEEIFFGGVTTGASDDLRRVTELVYSTIQVYGMNSRLGQLAFPKDPNAMFEDRPYSDATAKAMDEEAKSIVDAAYLRTLDLLRERKDDVEKLAALLLEKETITHDDMVDLLGERPYHSDPAYNEFIRRKMKTGGEKKANEEEAVVDDEQDGAKDDTDASGLLNPAS
jgi:AFG3 family protein